MGIFTAGMVDKDNWELFQPFIGEAAAFDTLPGIQTTL